MRRLDGEGGGLDLDGRVARLLDLIVGRCVVSRHRRSGRCRGVRRGPAPGCGGRARHQVAQRVVSRGRLRDAGEQRRFRQRQVLGRLAEVALAGRLDAGVDAAVADLVDVPGEDLVLGVALGQLHGEDHLADLAVDAAGGALVAGDVDVLDQLLRDRAAAGAAQRLAVDEGAEVLGGGAFQAADVDAGVAVEGRVFGSDRGGQEGRADLVQVHGMAQAVLVIDVVVEQLAVAVQDGGAGGRAVDRNLVRRDQALGVALVRDEQCAQADCRAHHDQKHEGEGYPQDERAPGKAFVRFSTAQDFIDRMRSGFVAAQRCHTTV